MTETMTETDLLNGFFSTLNPPSPPTRVELGTQPAAESATPKPSPPTKAEAVPLTRQAIIDAVSASRPSLIRCFSPSGEPRDETIIRIETHTDVTISDLIDYLLTRRIEQLKDGKKISLDLENLTNDLEHAAERLTVAVNACGGLIK